MTQVSALLEKQRDRSTAAALELAGLTELMSLTPGRPEVCVALIDGPVAAHPDLSDADVRVLPADPPVAQPDSAACRHGTFVAGMLWARGDSAAPAICPGCSFVVRPVLGHPMPVATPETLAAALIDCVDAGARIVNLSAAAGTPLPDREREVEQALDYAARRGVIVIAAAGNQGWVGSSAVTRHPGVIPVTACDLAGRPLRDANVSGTIGRRGLAAPGADISSLNAGGGTVSWSGTSVAAPFVTGAAALLWSLFPRAPSEHVRLALLQPFPQRRATVFPPMLNARTAYGQMIAGHA
ncbi:MAG: S8 family serine peptidase [Egibacteraceae bacterium]